MVKRLILYFFVVFVLIVVATSANRYFLEKKETMTKVLEETSDFLEQQVPKEGSSEESVFAATQEVIDPQFVRWFGAESAQIDSTSLNSKAKEKELVEIAKSLDEKKIHYLQKTSLSPESSQAEKMLSIYMLALGGNATQTALVDIASQDLNLNPAEPHTVDEVKNNQLRANQIIAIDAIAESQREPSSRIEDLQKIITKTNDVFIKDYAQRKQDEVRTQ